jgi:hypothetical protein
VVVEDVFFEIMVEEGTLICAGNIHAWRLAFVDIFPGSTELVTARAPRL